METRNRNVNINSSSRLPSDSFQCRRNKSDFDYDSPLVCHFAHWPAVKCHYNVFTASGMIILLLLIGMPAATTQKTHRLFWDDKNPVFNYGNNRMFVEEGDDITIVCPFNSYDSNDIYWSKKNDAYDTCNYTYDPSAIKLITCDPQSNKEFNFQVTKFSWVSLNPTFLPGKPIYLLSQPEFCTRYNMKIAIILKTHEHEKKEILKEAASPERVIQLKHGPSHYSKCHFAILASLISLMFYS